MVSLSLDPVLRKSLSTLPALRPFLNNWGGRTLDAEVNPPPPFETDKYFSVAVKALSFGTGFNLELKSGIWGLVSGSVAELWPSMLQDPGFNPSPGKKEKEK